MITKTKSNEWVNIKIEDTNKMDYGEKDISWIYEFLGWSKNAKKIT